MNNTSRNDHTLKLMSTGIKATSDAYRDGWERAFGVKHAAHCERVTHPNSLHPCTCGAGKAKVGTTGKAKYATSDSESELENGDH